MAALRSLEIETLNEEFESRAPEEIIRWAVNEFGKDLVFTASFGPESGTLLHMLSRIDPAVTVLFLNTGYHFPETLDYRDRLIRLFGLKGVKNLTADPQKEAELGDKPYERSPDACCRVHKVEPLLKALEPFEAWVSGIRRHQTDFRKSVRILEEYEGRIYKISPLANFTSREVWWYMKEHEIPQHPLFEKGYLSIGCRPCTRPIQAGDDERSGRWAGKNKSECGIHTVFKETNRAPGQDSGNVSKEAGESI